MSIEERSSNIFEARATTIHDLYMGSGQADGFRIPIYQRNFEWDKSNIDRLYEDICTGLTWLVEDDTSYTFLGSIIMVSEKTSEDHFDGNSYSIIDGQQRLTSLSIISTKLYQEINSAFKKLVELPNDVEVWLKKEVAFRTDKLKNLALGTIDQGGGQKYKFPKIVREIKDSRARTIRYATYNSPIAEYLFEFGNFIENHANDSFDFNPKKDNDNYKAFVERLDYIIKLTEKVSSGGDEDIFNFPEAKDFERVGFRKLFKKLPITNNKDQTVLQYCQKSNVSVLNFYKLLAFATYMMDSVVVSVVDTKEEKYAFEIFDSLNTTGEPLTAIQTFKPQVVKFERTRNGYEKSTSKLYFEQVENYLDGFPTSYQKQLKSKELVIPFALYLTGERRKKKLDDQRHYFRTNFDKIPSEDVSYKHLFIKALKEVADYKQRFWDAEDLTSELHKYPDHEEREVLLLCLKFLNDLKKSLTIPILCRFYHIAKEQDNIKYFAKSLLALTAFVAIRRGFTGGTAGIDRDFRLLMQRGRPNKSLNSKPLCKGLFNDNEKLELTEFKQYLIEWLEKKGIQDKKTWVNKVIYQGLANESTDLCRFLILAASHYSRPDDNENWKLKKVRKSQDIKYLNYGMWISSECKTIEHIAPQSRDKSWDIEIYNQNLIHTLGNLILLPQLENNILGNRSWELKKKLFHAFTAKTKKDVDKIIEESKKDGFQFSKKNKKVLYEGVRLPLLQSIVTVDDWNSELIKNRSENIASLAWDQLSPWLFD